MGWAVEAGAHGAYRYLDQPSVPVTAHLVRGQVQGGDRERRSEVALLPVALHALLKPGVRHGLPDGRLKEEARRLGRLRSGQVHRLQVL